MNFALITEHPWWFIIFCLLTGAAYALLLYRKGAKADDFPPFILKTIAFFRFTVVTILCFLLLGPMVRTITRIVEKPVFILAVDNSRSVTAAKDSVQRKQEVKEMMQKITDPLRTEYEVHVFTFGDKVKENAQPDFTDGVTDFSALYNELNIQFLNRNVGAMVIASDGIYNSGSSPVNGPSRVKAPLYTVALGDTTVYRDVVLTSADHNKTAFLGNSFPIEVQIDARQASGTQTELVVEEEGTVLFRRPVSITGNRFHATVPVFPEAKSKGLKHYKLSLVPVSGERTVANNSRDIYIEVVESRQKVLILAAAPHPDLSALKSSIAAGQNLDADIKYAVDFNGSASGYNLIILHGLPGVAPAFNSWMEQWQKQNISLWYIITSATSINNFNALKTGITITNANNSLNESLPAFADGFSLFSFSDQLKNNISSWPPLSSPFGVYNLDKGGYNFLMQRIGTVNTGQPLLSFIPDNNTRIAVLSGEGIWKWRLHEFEQSGNNEIFREFISRTVQYLAATGNREPFRVQFRNAYAENEAVLMNAELYDATGKLVNEPEVKVTLISADDKQYSFTFTRTDNAYSLNAGLLPSGRYRFRAETKLGDQLYTDNGEFSINALQLELVNTIADHQLLYATADRNGGAMFYPGQEEALLNALKKREDITAVSYQQKKLSDLVEQPWVFILLMTLLAAEWILRKRNGVY